MVAVSDIRVVIVDDESVVRSAVRHSLEQLGFKQIFEAENSTEGLPMARQHRVHLIISDYQMPTMTGLEFLEAVRADRRLAKVGFVMISGSRECSLVDKAAELGADSFIVKPFSVTVLQEHVKRVLARVLSSQIAFAA